MYNFIDPATVQQIAEVNTDLHNACSKITTLVRLHPAHYLMISSVSNCPASTCHEQRCHALSTLSIHDAYHAYAATRVECQDIKLRRAVHR